MKVLKAVFLFITILTMSTAFGQAPLTLTDYMDATKSNKLDYLLKVESTDNVLTLKGYRDDNNKILIKKEVVLERNEVLALWGFNHVLNSSNKSPISISLSTVPYKIRPSQDGFNVNAVSGLTNIGFNVELAGWNLDKYFASGNKSSHNFHVGLWFAPLVAELDSIHTDGFFSEDVKSKQLFLSSAITFNYTYNNLTFSFIPIGFDFATTDIGQEWVYNKQNWWGFGIGIEPKFLTTIKNK